VADPLQVLAEPRRQAILRLVWERERAAGEIHEAMPEVTFPAVSQHLRRLRDAGLVEVRTEGRHRYYRADKDALGPLAAALEAMWDARLDALKHLAELDEEDT
jgi:DNA-binding transcriptional ArsR family regulator